MELTNRQPLESRTNAYAVIVRGACKSFGSGKKSTQVLRGLNMTVPRGCIYGLLGASGCGKTTLLSGIVGRQSVEARELWVLGGRPGEPGSGVPGFRVGYMPQELALMDEFTIRETFVYFSWIYGMKSDELEERISVLNDVLKLPPHDRFVKNLSTGQQRRVSLGAALLHDPELMVLDEPTVGVDPVLRQGIWDHLLEITSKANRTVIITTHYIDEAKQADYVGLMRGGCLVAESSPEHLLRLHNADTLESVFLELCRRQNRECQEGNLNDVIAEKDEADPPADGEISAQKSNSEDPDHELTAVPRHQNLQCANELNTSQSTSHITKRSTTFGEWKALHFKNMKRFVRNPGHLGFVFGFPIFQIVLYFMAIGGDPTDLPVAIVNQETLYSYPVNCSSYVKGYCNDTTLSCRYLETLKSSVYMEAKVYPERDEALEEVRRGRAWGAVIIPENFTKALIERRERGTESDNGLINTGDIEVHLDMSNQQLSTLIRRRIYTDLSELYQGIISDCGLNPRIGSSSVKFHDPIFGVREPNFQSFTTPAVIITTVFFLALGLTATLLVTERTEGMWDRTMVMGITPWQLLESHLEWQVLLICGQILEVAILMLFVYKVELRGAVILLLVHMFLQGMSGMSFGFLVSICSKHVSEANYMATGSFLPMIVMSGAMWPLEGMPRIFRYLAYAMPSTMATESLRSIMFRGWGLEMYTVYMGYAVTLAWIVFFVITCRILLLYKKL